MIVIGIAGKMGAGKDTVAQLLQPFGFQRFAFADALREEVADAIDGGRRDMPACLSSAAQDAFLYAPVSEVWEKPTTGRMRALLQEWGTEYRRSQDEHYWTSIMREKLAGAELACISDVRFPDEAALVRKMGGRVWVIHRPGAGGNGHVSESLDFAFDHVIHNTGDIANLEREVVRVLTIQGVSL